MRAANYNMEELTKLADLSFRNRNLYFVIFAGNHRRSVLMVIFFSLQLQQLLKYRYPYQLLCILSNKKK